MTQVPRQNKSEDPFKSTDAFVDRHIGPNEVEIQEMLKSVGYASLDELIKNAVPPAIRTKNPLKTGIALSEYEALSEMRAIASENKIFRTYIGMGYNDCITPPVIQRNIIENPGWYTQYTPYQAEIAQGRLEALLNFQTMIMDLTGMGIANASMLDEGTSAAEAMTLCLANAVEGAKTFFVSEDCHPQTIDVVRTRANPLGIEIVVGDHRKFNFSGNIFGVLLQYPATDGVVYDYASFIAKAHANKSMAVVAADLLSLCLLKSPGEFGADIVVGNTQRFGVPLGFGGPHAAYLATKDEFKRQMPGRIVGVSIDANGKPALRLALQTREQHIRRAKATSNICTAQVLLAVMASMYAVYHGPKGLKKIAQRVHGLASTLAYGLEQLGYKVATPFFDTLKIEVGEDLSKILSHAQIQKMNFRKISNTCVSVSLDETVTTKDLQDLLQVFSLGETVPSVESLISNEKVLSTNLLRQTEYLTHPVFSKYHSETEMLRYMQRLQAKDLSLTTSMIPLGSCTMKLNATAEMFPVTWPEFGKIHPFVPAEQVKGYRQLTDRLETMLADITGFDGVSLQPNAGSQGEYAGLLVIQKYHHSRGEGHRDVCLIPNSAHGTNPASAVMAGLKVVGVECDASGNVRLDDLRKKAEQYSKQLSSLMITYPSTHGVFEETIIDICNVVHQHGGQVYMDGANMNAQVGLCKPGEFGADVCHLNLHKTFCIPHGGGGPGMGPIGVKSHLTAFLPSNPMVKVGGEQSVGAISAAPWGSASILPISFVYILMMGALGLKKATEVAILNANYVAKKLDKYYPVLYRGSHGLVAHECIVDLRPLKVTSGVEVMDVAKRLMDYGFHAPTVSFPVIGTMMIEPTESETQGELDRFCDAMISIRKEITEIEDGKLDRDDNMLKHAPHTAATVIADKWEHPYSRERAAFPAPWTKQHKFWPSVSRINDPHGDRNLICSCPTMETYS
ncbi:MAG: aminomethyl-transferring glycine dehydrogenase [Oligoflexia bacterium]|nr:aminomethyl-transferring glycine dehydrogenase [Oligoflexia bacterium]